MPIVSSVRGSYGAQGRFGKVILNGSSSALAAPNATYLIDNGITTNGTYWIKPTGYGGSAFQIYCDLTGTASGIGTGGWMKITYASDKYTQGAPYTLTGNGSPGDGIPYAGDFAFSLPDAAISALLNITTETRGVLESWGKGSVGWTYDGTYMGAKAWNNSTHRGASSSDNSNLLIGGSAKPSSISYAFPNGGGGITNFNNAGTDPTDINDDVWRQSFVYVRENGTRQYFPMRGIYVADADSVNEERYWPVVSGAGSYYWVK